MGFSGRLSGLTATGLLRSSATTGLLSTAGLFSSLLLALLSHSEKGFGGLAYLRFDTVEASVLLALGVGLLQLALVTGEGSCLNSLDELLLELLGVALSLALHTSGASGSLSFRRDGGSVTSGCCSGSTNRLSATEACCRGAASAKVVPDERILIETDRSDCCHFCLHSLSIRFSSEVIIAQGYRLGGVKYCVFVNLLNSLLTFTAER